MATLTFDEQEAAAALRLEQSRARQQADGDGPDETAEGPRSLRAAQQTARRALASKAGKTIEDEVAKKVEGAANKWLWAMVVPTFGLSIIGLDAMLIVSAIRGKVNIPNALAVLFVSAVYYLLLFGLLYVIVFIGSFVTASLSEAVKLVFDFGWEVVKPIKDLLGTIF